MAISQQAILVLAAATAGAVLASQTPCIAESADKLYSGIVNLVLCDEFSIVGGALLFFCVMYFVGGNPFAVSSKFCWILLGIRYQVGNQAMLYYTGINSCCHC